MDEASTCPRTDFRAIRDAHEVGVTVCAEFVLDFFAGCDDERLDGFTSLDDRERRGKNTTLAPVPAATASTTKVESVKCVATLCFPPVIAS